MLAARINPWFAFQELQREVDRVLDTVGVNSPRTTLARVFPALNVWDEGDALVAEAELPGLKSDDLEILAQGNTLTLKGTRRTADADGAVYHRRERESGGFSRIITLPADVDAERVEATLKDGVLTVRLPKAEAARPRKVTVSTN